MSPTHAQDINQARIARCRRALARRPEDDRLRLQLAEALTETGQFDEAARAFTKLLARKPGNAQVRAGARRAAGALRREAGKLKQSENFKAAADCYRRCLELDPNDADAHLSLGTILYERKNKNLGVQHWRRAIELNPKLGGAHHNLGVHLRHKRRYEEALDAFQSALASDPDYEPTHVSLGRLLAELGRYEEAEKLCQDFLSREPDAEETTATLAKLYELQGRIEDAYQLLRPLVDRGTLHPEIIIIFGTVCHRRKPVSEEAVPHIEALLNKGNPTISQRVRALATLAQLHDATEQYAAAFACLKSAREIEPVDESTIERDIEFAESVRTYYTRTRMDNLPHASNKSELPLFVVGMPRSGTTLTEQILSTHPRVHGAGELTQIGRLVVSGFRTNKPLPDCLAHLNQARMDAFSTRLLGRLLDMAPNAERIIDKMPLNYFHLGAIELLLPGARIIHCTRHPLDTCLSIYFNQFASSLAYTRDLTALGRTYRSYTDLMTHWKTTIRLPLLTLNYETLVREPEPTVRELLTFCGLEWHDECLRFSESRRHVNTPSYHQVRQPLYNRSVGRYKAYEPWLGELIDALGDALDGWPT